MAAVDFKLPETLLPDSLRLARLLPSKAIEAANQVPLSAEGISVRNAMKNDARYANAHESPQEQDVVTIDMADCAVGQCPLTTNTAGVDEMGVLEIEMPTEAPPVQLDSFTVVQLRALAMKHAVDLGKTKAKAQIIQKLRSSGVEAA